LFTDKEALKKDIEIELKNLQRLTKEMEELMSKLPKPLGFIETRAAGSILHDFYCGIEKIFERIALVIDRKMPEGEDWHKQLLKQMATPLEGIRKEVIKEDLFLELKEYLSFRRLFRHIYGFNLKWGQFSRLCYSIDSLKEKLKFVVMDFLKH
jgi:hypothetical protein